MTTSIYCIQITLLYKVMAVITPPLDPSTSLGARGSRTKPAFVRSCDWTSGVKTQGLKNFGALEYKEKKPRTTRSARVRGKQKY